jgi:hypothetical protein
MEAPRLAVGDRPLGRAVRLRFLPRRRRQGVRFYGQRSAPEPLSGDLVWTCHFCHRERRDEFIRTASVEATVGNVPIRHTRRYCIDRPDCVDAAHFWQANADHYGRLPKA